MWSSVRPSRSTSAGAPTTACAAVPGWRVSAPERAIVKLAELQAPHAG
jgi:hypothetical protein